MSGEDGGVGGLMEGDRGLRREDGGGRGIESNIQKYKISIF